MKRWLGPALAIGLLSLMTWGALGRTQEDPAKRDVKAFMRAKLTHMQKALEGITTEDYDLITESASKMRLLSLDAQWRVFPTEEYQQHSREFRRVASTVIEAAKKKNLDAAALGYVDLTMKCVSCHSYMRKVRLTKFELPPDLQSSLLKPLPLEEQARMHLGSGAKP